MLSHQELVDLYRELDDQDVLSVYIDADERDPAKRRAWRRRLDDSLAGIRQALGDDPSRGAFDAARKHIDAALADYEAFLPGRGWIAFATADGLRYVAEVPVPTPNVVRWERGLHVAPYIRALKQNRPVAAALLDSRNARIYLYQAGTLGEPIDLQTDKSLEDMTETAATKRAMVSSGRRGVTAADAAQRAVDEGARRLIGDVLEEVERRIGSDGFLVLGGASEMVTAAAKRLPRSLEGRTLERPSLNVGMSANELKDALEEAASELTRRWQGALLDDVIDQARSGGRGALGIASTQRALRERRVETLLISRSLRELDGQLANELVREALLQGSGVEELSGEAAERLASEADGTGARLRYRPRESEPS